ncbi:hypothetical protein [Paenibacillus agaridevorans]|jgi:hypothetical protein|uniref:hypothetical protein n=1 Tax=Paenibacillus agaridevorans TaxID=171404 RepID=UPI001BE4AF28|nr:hypothetical protein [Paenibacillus agaridevorans]
MEEPKVLTSKEFIELTMSHKTVSFPENDYFQRELFLTEYWRSILFEIAFKSDFPNDNIQPVHNRKIKNMLRQQVDAIWPELKDAILKEESDFTKHVRQCLEKIGDIVHLKSGFYVPLPLRIIDLPESEYAVIVGGTSTTFIRNMLPSARISGYGRIVEKNRIPDSIKTDRHLWQDYSNWIGWKPENIKSWMTLQMRQLSTLGSQSIQGFDEFEVYNSLGHKERGNRSFWIDQRTIQAQKISGVLLCKTVDSNKRYFLGELKDGCLLKELTITATDTIRWLMIGFRLESRRSPIARWNDNFLKVNSPLPQALERHILVFSLKQNTFEYYVCEQVQDHVEQFLKSHGYEIWGTRRNHIE